jgi:formate dehydrogenase subunit gamma
MSTPDVVARTAPGTEGTGHRRVLRFTRVERIAHWVNAGLFLVVMATGAMFRFGIGQSLVSDRALARAVHVYAGLGILVAFVVAMAGRWGRSLRLDVRRLGRWSRDDTRWLRTFGGDTKLRLGKFNPGQKLNATFIAAAAVILAGTGSIMFWNKNFSTDLRTGADFVHGWFALGVGLSVFGHVLMALRDRESLRGMTRGTVSVAWARHHRPAWRADPVD